MTEAQKRANAKYNHSEKGKAAKRKYMREYSQTDEYKEYMREYRKSAKGKVSFKKSKRKYQQTDKGKVVDSNASHRRRAIIKNAGSYTAEEWNDLLARYNYTCLCCGRVDRPLTADHVIPLSLGGSNSIDNIQPLCQRCNSTKGIRYIDYR